MPRKKKPENNYWNQAVEDAICAYISSTSESERNKLYKTIYPALCKVSEVWFNKLKVSYIDTDKMDMQMDCVIHMTEKLPMFQCGKGTKAFSYFTVTAKFFYMIHNQANYKYQQRWTPMSYMSVTFDKPNTEIRDAQAKEAADLLEAFTLYLTTNFEEIFLTKQTRLFGTELINRLENFENIKEINRRKIVHELAAIKGMPTVHNITKCLNTVTGQYNLFKERWKNGNPSLSFINKTSLTLKEKEEIKKLCEPSSKHTGYAGLSKKYGVTEHVIKQYITSIDLQ